VEWPPVVVRGRRGPWHFAEALPSEDEGSIRERLGGDPLAREKARRLSMKLLDRGGYALGRAFPLEGLQQQGLVESIAFRYLGKNHRVTTPGVCILYPFTSALTLHLHSAFTFLRMDLCSL
jgi:hypothetical protein